MRRRDRILVLFAHLAAALVAGLVWRERPDAAPWLRCGLAGLSAAGLLWLLGVLRGNPRVFDPFWSVAPIAVVAAWAADPGSAAAVPSRQFMVVALVAIWGLRLTYHWWRTFESLEHEDWRYADMRRASGRLFPLVNLVVIHLLPTLMLLLACAAAYPALVTGARPFGALDVFAALVTLAAIVLEARSDRIMRAFRATRQPGQICETGPWGWLRHPNYLGELEAMGDQRTEVEPAAAHHLDQAAHPLLATGAERGDDAIVRQAGAECIVGKYELSGVDAEAGQGPAGP